jgi:hypothetical protein
MNEIVATPKMASRNAHCGTNQELKNLEQVNESSALVDVSILNAKDVDSVADFVGGRTSPPRSDDIDYIASGCERICKLLHMRVALVKSA